MKIVATRNGTMLIGRREDLFAHCVERIAESGAEKRSFSIGLTGGSTPKAFYRWAVENESIPEVARQRATWSVSDERMVPLADDESNFGNADRLLLGPLGVPEANKLPWPVHLDPHSAAAVFNRKWTERFGGETGFDLCFLGMGDDGHTASIFPGSPLLGLDTNESFTCVDVPGKGWRLTITETGLSRCRRIVVLVTGEGKRERLRDIMEGPDTLRYPVQLLSRYQDRVLWLVDDEAAAGLA